MVHCLHQKWSRSYRAFSITSAHPGSSPINSTLKTFLSFYLLIIHLPWKWPQAVLPRPLEQCWGQMSMKLARCYYLSAVGIEVLLWLGLEITVTTILTVSSYQRMSYLLASIKFYHVEHRRHTSGFMISYKLKAKKKIRYENKSNMIMIKSMII